MQYLNLKLDFTENENLHFMILLSKDNLSK